MDEVSYPDLLEKFKIDYVFLLQNAIRNDDSSKDKLRKINALTHQLNNSYERFIGFAEENNEPKLSFSIIDEHRNLAA